MRALSSSEVLDLWDRGASLHALDRGLLALSMVLPDTSTAELADWPLGRRNRALLELHCSFFGPSLQGWAGCVNCGDKMEFELNGRELAENGARDGLEESVRFENELFRLPTSRDLAMAAQNSDLQSAAVAVIERCRTNVDIPFDWDEMKIDELGSVLAAADPLAEIRIGLCCPTCGNESEETIEITQFIWSEIEAQAKRTLWEVHALASAYGWTELEILSLASSRRARYLELVRA